jgi:hypothetical protein
MGDDIQVLESNFGGELLESIKRSFFSPKGCIYGHYKKYQGYSKVF